MNRKALIPVGVKKRRTVKLNKNFQSAYIDKFPKKIPKFIGLDINQTVTLNSPLVLLINGLTEGVTNGTRIGQEVLFKSIHVRYNIIPNTRVNNGGTAVLVPSYRVSVVYDNSPNGATLPAYNGTNKAIFNGALPNDLPLFANSDRYQILYTEYVTPECTSTYNVISGGSTSICAIDYNIVRDAYRKIALRGKFNGGNNGDITDFNTGAIYLCISGDGGINGPYDDRGYINIDTRIRFVDV